MYAIGIDIGGTTIKLGCVLNGTDIVFRDRRLSPREPEAMVNTILEMAAIAERSFPGAPVGISCAGSIDGAGYVTANHLGWQAVPLGPMIDHAFGTHVAMDNDALCALEAERRYGVLRGVRTGILITLGTGIGGGVLINGLPMRGYYGMHGEIGHMVTHAGGRQCSCGQRGCWEAYAAGSVLRRTAGKPVKEVIANIRAGRMLDLWESYLEEVAIGLGSLMMMFMPEVIAIGGGLSNAGEIVVGSIQRVVMETSAFRRYTPFVQIVAAGFGNDAGVLGAASLTEPVAP